MADQARAGEGVDRLSYLAGWNDAKAGRQYGEGRTVRDNDPWWVPPGFRPSCPLGEHKPCTSWTCLVDVCAEKPEDNVFPVAHRPWGRSTRTEEPSDD